MSALGHNSVDDGQLRSIVERAERLREQKAEIDDDLKELYHEARGNGYDAHAIKAVIKYRAEDSAKRAERDAVFDLYLAAINGTNNALARVRE